MSTIAFGKIINQLLNKESLNQYIEGRVYPIIATNYDKYPFILYRRDSLNEEKNKDSKYAEILDYEIIIVSNTYEKSVEVAENLRSEMEQIKNVVIDEYNIYSIDFINSKEGALKPGGAPLLYTQSLFYRFRIRN